MTKMFNQAMEMVFGSEGTWSDHPMDRGGKTMLGITLGTLKRVRAPESISTQDLRDLSVEQAIEIYQEHYWQPIVDMKLPPALTVMVFDMHVNSSKAVQLLQKTIKTTADGHWGPKSKAKLTASLKKYGEQSLLYEYSARRAVHYATQWNFVVFGLGWMRRIFHTLVVASSFVTTPSKKENKDGD